MNVQNKEFPLWIGCANYLEYENGFLCFIEPHKLRLRPLRRFFRSTDSTGPVAALRVAIDRILTANPAIKDIRWWTYEEFNPGAR